MYLLKSASWSLTLVYTLVVPSIWWLAGISPSFASNLDKVRQIDNKLAQLPSLPPPTKPLPSSLPPLPPANEVCFLPISPLSFPRIPTLPLFLFSSADGNLGKIAVQYAATGQYDQAVKISQSIQDKYFLATALVGIADFEYQKRPQQARQLLSQSLSLVPSITENYTRDSILNKIAIQYANLEEFKLALEITQKISNRSIKDETITEIALKYVAKGRQTQAIRLIETLRDNYQKNDALVRIAGHYAESGKYNQALEFADALKDNNTKYEAYNQILRQAFKTGQADPIVRQIQSINDDCIKLAVATRLASFDQTFDSDNKSANNNTQRISLALAIAQTIKSDTNKSNALENIVREYIAAGQIEQALQLTQTIVLDSNKNRALTRFVEHYLAANQPDQALIYAQMMGDSFYKADTLTEIATSYAKAGQVDKASGLLSQALEINNLAAKSGRF